jgi:hypothetical protein
MGREGFLRKPIELSSRGIALNGSVEPVGVKNLEPCTETCQLPRIQLLNGFFDVFSGRHMRNIASVRRYEKVRVNAERTPTPARSPAAARR